MTLTEFSRDIVPIVAATISLGALVVMAIGLYSLWLIKAQIDLSSAQIKQAAEASRQAMEWNRNQAHHTFFANTPSTEKAMRLTKEMLEARLDPETPIDERSYATIEANHVLRVTIVQYLNDFEELCAAVHAGTVDENIAYGLDCTGVIVSFHRYKFCIARWREKRKSDTLYIELEKTATRWDARRLDERKAVEEKLASIQAEAVKLEKRKEQLRHEHGVKRSILPDNDR